MVQYGAKWALGVLEAWENSYPRVKLAVARFANYFEQFGIPDAENYVKRRLLYAIRNARNQEPWQKIKKMVADNDPCGVICLRYLVAPWIDIPDCPDNYLTDV